MPIILVNVTYFLAQSDQVSCLTYMQGLYLAKKQPNSLIKHEMDILTMGEETEEEDHLLGSNITNNQL